MKIKLIKEFGLGKAPPKLMQDLGVATFVEIGIRNGDSFFRHITGVSKHAVAIDIWRETGNPAQNDAGFGQPDLDKQYEKFLKKVSEINTPKISIHREFSAKAASLYPDAYFDWVFIDGDHSYEGCKEDIECWLPKVKDGGVLSGHDYMVEHTVWRGVPCGVKQAVDEFVQGKYGEAYKERFHVSLNSPNPTWYLVV